MSRNDVRVLLILATIGAEILLLITAFGGAAMEGASGRDGRPILWFLLGHMPVLAVGVLACLIAKPWPTRFAMIVGFLLLGIDTAFILSTVVDTLAEGRELSWLAVLFDLPGLIILAGVWLMVRARPQEPSVAGPPVTGDWR